MSYNKVVYDGKVLVDLTGDTVTPAKLLSGVKAHDASGASIIGSIASVTQATPSISVSSTGLITASASQSGGLVAAGTKNATKQLSVQAAQTIMPGTADKTIASGKYLTGTQTIKGDTNLEATNIKKGVSIFGISGSYEESGLNMSVVGGTTQPTSPAENTVWVNTDTEISGYAFSATQPTSPVAGMVWFSTGTSSNAAMNIDKENTVMLYPKCCSQYIGGAWVTKTAKVYQNGAWVEMWTGMLFNNGDEYTVITGGFSGVGSCQKAENSGGYLRVLAGYGATGAYLTNDPIDLTDFTTLAAIVRGTGSNTKALGIAKERGTNFTARKSITATSDTAITLDISGYTGAYYVGILSNSNNSVYAKQIKLEV